MFSTYLKGQDHEIILFLVYCRQTTSPDLKDRPKYDIEFCRTLVELLIFVNDALMFSQWEVMFRYGVVGQSSSVKNFFSKGGKMTNKVIFFLICTEILGLLKI
jgi:hypothetical protein